ncbi:MAG: DUF883 family protein [Thiothrix sp.]|jgi:ElaB/YqjD/DUF883 family membrane-anchored ribosome-binding protein|nr:MAG: DUF883 family protein [Thiothrix sp.]
MAKPQESEFDIQAEFGQMKAQLASLLASLEQQGEAKAASLNGQLTKELEDYKEIALKKAQQVQAVSHEGLEQVSQYVKANPLASLGIAFSVGFVLSRLLSGKSS